ncbi:MAG TPA: class I SAM-dependent methyltransferase [Anaeromyxobacteraceae bacterium]|nr:class I SAM-dependent methyltransferase [Anaeromyxobacteraceae bacterium]
MEHWGDAYYGDLYLDSVEDLLSPRLSAIEAEAVARSLALGPGDRVLDLACGHGRHARILSGRVASLVGLDRSGAYLRLAARARAPGAAFARGDVRALPFRDGAFDAAWSWYASLFMFDDPTNERCLAEAARVIRPGGRLLVHHANPATLAERPRDSARRTLRDGSVVEETSEFDPGAGVDRCTRRLIRPSGATLAATAELRYYNVSEWGPLSRSAGLRIAEVNETPQDLAVLLEKPA